MVHFMNSWSRILVQHPSENQRQSSNDRKRAVLPFYMRRLVVVDLPSVGRAHLCSRLRELLNKIILYIQFNRRWKL